jgi:hypothetical protein
MKKTVLVLTGVFCLGYFGVTLAQDSTGQDNPLPVLKKPNSRYQPMPAYTHEARGPFKLDKPVKKTEKGNKRDRYFPLTPLPTVPVNQVILQDKQGKPVTLFPNLKAKNYSTIFQDKKP